MSNSVWRIGEQIAELCLPQVNARFDWRRPASGLFDLRIGAFEVSNAGLLQVDLSDPLENEHTTVECYARGDDLIATYGEQPSRPLRAQVYYRNQPHDPATAHAAIELVASVQTSLLDSDPQLEVRSRLAAAAIWRLTQTNGAASPAWQRVALQPGQDWTIDQHFGHGAFLLRLPGDYSYAEFVHPVDFHRTTLTMQDPAGGSGWPMVNLRHMLFTQRLEKGVILRARLLGVLLPRADDLTAALSFYRAFAAAEPPLTT